MKTKEKKTKKCPICDTRTLCWDEEKECWKCNCGYGIHKGKSMDELDIKFKFYHDNDPYLQYGDFHIFVDVWVNEQLFRESKFLENSFYDKSKRIINREKARLLGLMLQQIGKNIEMQAKLGHPERSGRGFCQSNYF